MSAKLNVASLHATPPGPKRKEAQRIVMEREMLNPKVSGDHFPCSSVKGCAEDERSSATRSRASPSLSVNENVKGEVWTLIFSKSPSSMIGKDESVCMILIIKG